jgi:hypothetical protein
VLGTPFLVNNYNLPAYRSEPVAQIAPAAVTTSTPNVVQEGGLIRPLAHQVFTGISPKESKEVFQDLMVFEKKVKKGISIFQFYQAWGQENNLFPVDWMDSTRQLGSLPLVTWEPWQPKSHPDNLNEPEFSLKNILDGQFDAYLHTWAQAAKSWRHPFFLRFAPEMNGGWVTWSELANGNQAGQFVQAWKYVYGIFKEYQVKNVTWVWCPNVVRSDLIPLEKLYPGDEYVDWIGMDGFNWGADSNQPLQKWQSFMDVFEETYRQLQTMSTKPIMIPEIGSADNGGNKAAWITDAYAVQLPKNFPKIKAVIWFDQITQHDWRLDSSPATFAAYTNAIQNGLYADNAFASYRGG